MAEKTINKHARRGSYDLFSAYSHYLPGYGGMVSLFLLFLLGSLLGGMLTSALVLISPEFAETYGTMLAYPIMFIPPMLYASAKSRSNRIFDEGYALDSNNFGRFSGFAIAIIVSIATIAAAFMADSLNAIMPPAPEWFEQAMEKMINGPVWVTLISVSVFAPLFEEWLCRGLILRGLLHHTNPSAAIAVSSAFFALLHMNPWQALPAFILGLLFGYVYYRTGSLKLTMLMHCVNNTMAVIFSKVPSLSEAEGFYDILSPWAYICIFLASAAFVASAVITLRGIPLRQSSSQTE